MRSDKLLLLLLDTLTQFRSCQFCHSSSMSMNQKRQQISSSSVLLFSGRTIPACSLSPSCPISSHKHSLITIVLESHLQTSLYVHLGHPLELVPSANLSIEEALRKFFIWHATDMFKLMKSSLCQQFKDIKRQLMKHDLTRKYSSYIIGSKHRNNLIYPLGTTLTVIKQCTDNTASGSTNHFLAGGG